MRNRWLYISASATIIAVLTLGLALGWRSAEQQRLEQGRAEICRNQNEIKGVLRTLVLARIRVEEALQKTEPLSTRDEVIDEFKLQLPNLEPTPC